MMQIPMYELGRVTTARESPARLFREARQWSRVMTFLRRLLIHRPRGARAHGKTTVSPYASPVGRLCGSYTLTLPPLQLVR